MIVRLIVALAALAAVFVLPMIQDAHADKEFMVIGSVDCGRASGQRCTVGSTITVWTTDVTGYLTKVTIDVSWVTNQLDAYDQDDQVCLDVRSGADGLQAIGVSTTCGVDPHHRSRVEDDPPPPPPPLAPTATPTKTNTPVIVTSTPTLTPTSTVTLTPTATNTSTPIPVADLSLTKTGDLFCNDGCFPDFVITVTNSGPNPATNVTVKDYPENFVIVSAIPSRGTYNMITNVWDIGPLGVGETVDISIFGTFTGPIAINTAEVLTSNPADPDSRPGNLGPGKAPVEDDEGQAIVPGLS